MNDKNQTYSYSTDNFCRKVYTYYDSFEEAEQKRKEAYMAKFSEKAQETFGDVLWEL